MGLITIGKSKPWALMFMPRGRGSTHSRPVGVRPVSGEHPHVWGWDVNNWALSSEGAMGSNSLYSQMPWARPAIMRMCPPDSGVRKAAVVRVLKKPLSFVPVPSDEIKKKKNSLLQPALGYLQCLGAHCLLIWPRPLSSLLESSSVRSLC